MDHCGGGPRKTAGLAYRLTAKGRKQLSLETTRWEKLARAIAGILRAAGQEGKS
jgi:hypothetical protein